AMEGLALAQRAGLQRSPRASGLATTIADLAFRLGEWGLVQSVAGPSIAQAVRGGFTVGPLVHLARVQVARGDLEDAGRWLSHVRNVGAGSLFLYNQGLWWTAMSNLELTRGYHEQAQDAVTEGLRIMETTTMVWPTTELTA